MGSPSLQSAAQSQTEPRVRHVTALPCLRSIESVDVLQRPFALLAFDWDGTAVTNRREDASRIRSLLENLLRLGVRVVVITGTNFQNVERQLTASMVGSFTKGLYICTNRGSEVYGFDDQSRPVLLWRRVATPDENRLLSEVADDVKRIVAQRFGLRVRVIYNRLNRRKIDLIPEPRWENPPKSEIGELLKAVEQRLTTAGVSGGIRDVFALTQEVARSKGLKNARITSDVKHIEIGLTDKGDSIEWALRNVAATHAIPINDVLIVGDEFGPIAGFEGSDARMLVSAAKGAVVVSVGREPNGVPPGVIHLGGGPACFRALLEQQVNLRRSFRPSESTFAVRPGSPRAEPPIELLADDQSWLLVQEGFDPAREREIESLFTIANGYLGTRGSVHGHSVIAEPATFVAGVYTQPQNSIPEYVIAPDWDRFNVFVNDEEIRLDRGQTLEHRRVLDMRRGVFEHVWRFCDRAGRITRLRAIRFVSLADRHALVEVLELTPENYSARVAVESVLDASEANAPVATAAVANPDNRQGTAAASPPRTPLIVREFAQDTGVVVVFAASSRLRDQQGFVARVVRNAGSRWAMERWEWEAMIGKTYRVDKLVTAYTSRNGADPERLAVERLAAMLDRGSDELLAEHERAWENRWLTADVEITGDAAAQRAIRFGIYHLIASSNADDEFVSIGARALTGESYKGHVFWDTEIYMLPFFAFSHPPSARALVMYRYHTLSAARDKARALGYRGALYPWESAAHGREATPPFALLPDGEVIEIRTAEQEHHISADVAYAAWLYWRTTGDDDLFREAGAEIILETARFWASRTSPGADGCYHILRVIGPDEYHESVDDNAYTNCLARWNLQRGLDTSRWLRERDPKRWAELSARLALGDDELRSWEEIAQKIYTGFDPRSGLFEQFRGYFELDEIDLAAFEPRTAPINVLLGRERVARSQIIKQADVVLLIYLLWDEIPAEARLANFRFYAPRCAHESSLSPSIHALVAARLGDQELAARYFRQAAEIDLANNMGNAAGGIHVGAQGGLWQSTIFGAGGLRHHDDGLAFDPRLLPTWQKLTFPLQWRGRHIVVSESTNPRAVEVSLERGEPMLVGLGEGNEPRVRIREGQRWWASATDDAWGSWTEVAGRRKE